jgi:hypothetical protein
MAERAPAAAETPPSPRPDRPNPQKETEMSLRLTLPLVAALALAACAEGPPPPVSPADTSLDPAEQTIAPGAEGLYEGDPLAGPDTDAVDDPL